MNAQELITVSNILAVNAFEEIRNWLPMPGVDGEVRIVGSRGYEKRYLYPEYAKIRAELIVEEQLRSAKTANGGKDKSGEDLPQLEWRKQVDGRLTAGERYAGDHEYRIQAWGEVISDALKKIVAQDERIAKLEAKLDEFENVATVDEVVGRVSDLERRLDAVNGMNVTAHGVIDQQHDKFRSRLDRLESASFAHSCLGSKVKMLDDAMAEALANTVETETYCTLVRRVEAITEKVNELAEDSVSVMPLKY